MYGLPFTLGIVDNMGTNREKRKAMACAMTFQFVFAVLLSRNTCYCCTTIFEIYKISCFYIIICTIIVSVYFYFYITFRFSEFRCINNTAFCSIRLRFDSSCLTIIIFCYNPRCCSSTVSYSATFSFVRRICHNQKSHACFQTFTTCFCYCHVGNSQILEFSIISTRTNIECV